MEVFSPSDFMLAETYVDRTLNLCQPKYLRFDAKPMSALQSTVHNFEDGFRVLKKGKKLAVISTGYMSQKAMEIIQDFDITLIDIYLINHYDKNKLEQTLKDVETLITIEEAFKNTGGLDAEINFNFKSKKIINLGFEKQYTFEIGDREFVHKRHKLGKNDIIDEIQKALM